MTLMPFSSWNVNKLRSGCCLLDTSLLRHIMTLFSENKKFQGGWGGGVILIFFSSRTGY